MQATDSAPSIEISSEIPLIPNNSLVVQESTLNRQVLDSVNKLAAASVLSGLLLSAIHSQSHTYSPPSVATSIELNDSPSSNIKPHSDGTGSRSTVLTDNAGANAARVLAMGDGPGENSHATANADVDVSPFKVRKTTRNGIKARDVAKALNDIKDDAWDLNRQMHFINSNPWIQGLLSRIQYVEANLTRVETELDGERKKSATFDKDHARLETQCRLANQQADKYKQSLQVCEQSEALYRKKCAELTLELKQISDALKKKVAQHAVQGRELSKLTKKKTKREQQWKQCQSQLEGVSTSALLDQSTLATLQQQHQQTSVDHRKLLEQHQQLVSQHQNVVQDRQQLTDQHRQLASQHEKVVLDNQQLTEQNLQLKEQVVQHHAALALEQQASVKRNQVLTDERDALMQHLQTERNKYALLEQRHLALQQFCSALQNEMQNQQALVSLARQQLAVFASSPPPAPAVWRPMLYPPPILPVSGATSTAAASLPMSPLVVSVSPALTPVPSPTTITSPPPCMYWLKGACQYGVHCRFPHPAKN